MIKVLHLEDKAHPQTFQPGTAEEFEPLLFNGKMLVIVPVAADYLFHLQAYCTLPSTVASRPVGRGFRVVRHPVAADPDTTAKDRVGIDASIRAQGWLYTVAMYVEPDVPLTFEFARKFPAALTLGTRILRAYL